MKNAGKLLINAVFVSCICASIHAAVASGMATSGAGGGGWVRQEVLLGNVFVPEVGYEDKNNIEITLDGYLPNGCFQLADTQIERTPDPFTILVHQFADRRTDGACSDPEALPPVLRAIVPYTFNVILGHLPVGEYRILFNFGSTPTRVSAFQVAAAETLTVDDEPYAAVSSVEIPDVVNGAHPVKAVLLGRLITTCQYIRQVKVLPEPYANVIVILPILGIRHGLCGQIIVPFKYTVDLGRLGEGRYLIHVRTPNGNAVTRAFSVVRPDPEMSQDVSRSSVAERLAGA